MKLQILDLESRLDPTRTIRETRMENITLTPERDYDTIFETEENQFKNKTSYTRKFNFK